MATIYDVSLDVCSPFVNYNDEQLKNVIREMFKNYKNPENGLGFDWIEDGFEVTKIR
jgi:hypothetical protein